MSLSDDNVKPTPYVPKLTMGDMNLMQVCIEDAKEISYPMYEGADPSTLQFAVLQTAFEFFKYRVGWLSGNPIEEQDARLHDLKQTVEAQRERASQKGQDAT